MGATKREAALSEIANATVASGKEIRATDGRAPQVHLQDYLDGWARSDPHRRAVSRTIDRIAETTAEVSRLISLGSLAGGLDAVVGDDTDGDADKEFDVLSNALFMASMRDAPVAAFASEENEDALVLREGAPLAVAVDPLDGSSKIDTNVSIGSIFSILPMPAAIDTPPTMAFLRPGSEQCASGFVVYGPQTALVLTVGAGVHIFTLDRKSSRFVLTKRDVRIPIGRREYAINAANYRHWDEPIRAYIDDCISGSDGPRESDFSMRWIASLVAEAFRIFARGGIFLYPRDDRPGYQSGRIRLIYEANPIALLAEQAGGRATDGETRILDLQPRRLHQRVPLVFGARDKVERVRRYHRDASAISERAPLFGRRGLFRV